jgi:hypothetical protein
VERLALQLLEAAMVATLLALSIPQVVVLAAEHLIILQIIMVVMVLMEVLAVAADIGLVLAQAALVALDQVLEITVVTLTHQDKTVAAAEAVVALA